MIEGAIYYDLEKLPENDRKVLRKERNQLVNMMLKGQK